MKKKYTFVLANRQRLVMISGDTLLYLINCQAIRHLIKDFQVSRELGNVNRPAILTLDCSDIFLKIMRNE